MKRLFGKLLLAGIPVFVILGVYLYKDPFKVLYHYDPYYAVDDSSYFELDDDFVATQTLIQNNPKYHYDSYIFGSSRSDNYLVSEFGRHVGSGKCYHFNAAYESLYGVERKVNFLDKEGYDFKNVLFVFDNDLLCKTKNENGHIRIKHPALSGQSWMEFQLEFLKDFFDKDFLYAYLDLSISGHLKNYMIEKDILSRISFHYDERANEIYQAAVEKQIANNTYYQSREHIFYRRDTVLRYTKPVLGAEQTAMLDHIRAILDKHHTQYKIVISPVYNQLKLDTTDLKTLERIFDQKNVYDFSGINSITSDKYNYYETSHYRPKVGTEIMNAIYSGPAQNADQQK